MKPKSEFPIRPLSFICLLATLPSLAFSAGLAAIKEQTFHQDAGANVIVYSKLFQDGGPLIKLETSNRPLIIERQKLAGNIEVIPSLPPSITNELELGIVQKTLKEYLDFTTRFPKSSPLLEKHITALNFCIKEFEGGKMRYNGKWMPKEEVTKLIQKEGESRQAEEAALKKKHDDRQAFEKSQKEKGFVEYDGKWIPKEEAKRLIAQAKEIQDRQIAAEKKRRRAEEEFESDGLVLLLKTELGETDEYSETITGTVINRTGHELRYATTEYKLYDASDAQIGTASAIISDLEADARWNYKATSFTKASKYKLSKLEGH